MKKNITKIKSEIEKLENDLKTAQGKCIHRNVTKKYGSNTGNYDPSCNCYWVDYHCSDCDYKWTEYK